MMLQSERDALEQPRDNGQVVFVPPGSVAFIYPRTDTRVTNIIRSIYTNGPQHNED
jgi:hypothetical protein